MEIRRTAAREILIKSNRKKQTMEKRGRYAELRSFSVVFRAFRGFIRFNQRLHRRPGFRGFAASPKNRA
jgi:hypothetical protein